MTRDHPPLGSHKTRSSACVSITDNACRQPAWACMLSASMAADIRGVCILWHVKRQPLPAAATIQNRLMPTVRHIAGAYVCMPSLTLWLPLSGNLAKIICKMVPLSGGPARTLPAKWRRYPGYGYNANCKMAPLSVWLALQIGPLPKNSKKKSSYNIYGFAINRIYKKKLYYMYISAFRWGSRLSRNYFSNVKTKAVTSDSRKVNGA